jgi:phage terminase large subunit-like protein
MNPLDVLAQLRLNGGALWTEAAASFQLEDIRSVLSEDGPPYGFLTRSRGASKTSDLAAAAMSVLLAAEEPLRLFWAAADLDQGRLALDCIDGYARRTSGLAGQLDIQTRRVVAPASGASLEIVPADAASAWGTTPDLVFVDEICQWGEGPSAVRLWEALSSAVTKKPGARLVILSTAGSPDHWSRKVLDHAEASPLWWVHEVHGPPPWADPVRIEEQRERLPHAVFQQLFENRWTQAEGSFLDAATIDRAFTLDGPSVGRHPSRVAGLDLGSVKDASVLSVGHREADDIVHLDRQIVWQGSRLRPVDFSEMERDIVAMHRELGGFTLRGDPWQALDLFQRLRGQGVRVEQYNFSQASKQRLAQTLLQALNAQTLRLYEAEGLRDELLGLRLVQASSGTWAFDHKRGKHDDRATALSLMLVAALECSIGAIHSAPSPWESVGRFKEWAAAQRRKAANDDSRPPIPRTPPPPQRVGNFLIRR